MSSRIRPTDSEWDILAALWQLGPSTVREVHEHLAHNKPTGYTTTLKLMQIMTEKGLLLRDERDRAHIYKPRHKRESLQSDAAVDLLDRLFSGSAADLMQRALSRRKPDRAELDRLKQLIQQYEEEKPQ